MIGRRGTKLGAVLVVAAGVALAALAARAETPAADPLAPFKALEGEWLAAEDGYMSKKGELVARYEVSAAGTAVVETAYPGSPNEMITVYHAEDREVVLTHYCMLGNQPRMRAESVEGARLDFAFDGGTNIEDPSRDRHMHSAWIEFVGPDELRSEWTLRADGEPALVVPMRMVRKRD